MFKNNGNISAYTTGISARYEVCVIKTVTTMNIQTMTTTTMSTTTMTTHDGQFMIAYALWHYAKLCQNVL